MGNVACCHVMSCRLCVNWPYVSTDPFDCMGSVRPSLL